MRQTATSFHLWKQQCTTESFTTSESALCTAHWAKTPATLHQQSKCVDIYLMSNRISKPQHLKHGKHMPTFTPVTHSIIQCIVHP
jgi:hypothetical protein